MKSLKANDQSRQEIKFEEIMKNGFLFLKATSYNIRYDVQKECSRQTGVDHIRQILNINKVKKIKGTGSIKERKFRSIIRQVAPPLKYIYTS